MHKSRVTATETWIVSFDRKVAEDFVTVSGKARFTAAGISNYVSATTKLEYSSRDVH